MITDRIAVLFDLDGVIIDSSHVMKAAFDHAYHQFFPKEKPPFKTFVKYMGQGFSKIMHQMNLPTDMYSHFFEKSLALTTEIQVFEGMRELLANLKEKNVYLGIVTGKDRYRTDVILKQNKLDTFFDKVVCGDDVTRGKPYPDAVEMHIHHATLSRSNLIFVGDSTSDIQCAHHANIYSIAVLWGQGQRHELFQEKPDWFVYNVDDLKHLFTDIHQGLFTIKQARQTLSTAPI